MLEAYVGPAAFRDGIRRYMRAHAYGNSVDADLWREVQAAAGKPVLDVEADFTRQAGVPLLMVQAEQPGSGLVKVSLRQGRFAEDPSTIVSAPAQLWRMPVTLSGSADPKTVLLSGSGETTVEVPGALPAIVNSGQFTYARTLYPQTMIPALSSRIVAANPADQLGLLYDAWALGQSGYAPVTDYLDLVRAVPDTADPVVWLQIVATLGGIDNLYEGLLGKASFVTFARELLHPMAGRLGWDAQANEEPNTATLRNAILVALSRFGDQAVVAEARRRFDIAQRDPQGVPPGVKRTSLTIVARNADAKTLDSLIAILRASKDPLEKQVMMTALNGIADQAGAQRVLDLAIGPDAIAGTTGGVLMTVAGTHPDLAWNFALQHADRLNILMSSSDHLFVIPGIAGHSHDPKRAAELQAYADKNIPSSAREDVESAIATIGLNVKFRTERLPQIDAWLANKPPR
jgi:aminopeptidase N